MKTGGPVPLHQRVSPRWRLVALLLLGAVLIAAAVVYLEYWVHESVGSGPAGPPVPPELFARPWTTRKVLLLGVGDSVTAGFGASRGHSYFDRLVNNPKGEFPELQGIHLSAVLPNLTVKNISVSGSTSIDHLRTLENKLQKQPDEVLGIVVMTTGGNDVIHNYGRTPPREGAMYGATFAQATPWIDNFRTRLDAMLDVLTERFPGGCHVFLADIYDPTDGVGEATSAGLPLWPDGLKVHAAYNEVIRTAASRRRNVSVVPMHQQFLGHGIYHRQPWREHFQPEDPHYWYHHNFEDPNDRGYDAIRRLFLIEMAQRPDVFNSRMVASPDAKANP